VRQEDWEKVADLEGITAIGYATEPGMGMQYISKAGNVHPLKALGWQHVNAQD
jgi:thiamine-monophosphate kinase